MNETIFDLETATDDEVAGRLGISRREFLKFCAATAATLGLPASAEAAIAKAMESAQRPSVIWLQFQECTGCTESLLRAEHPTLDKLILDVISLDYHETLFAAAGHPKLWRLPPAPGLPGLPTRRSDAAPGSPGQGQPAARAAGGGRHRTPGTLPGGPPSPRCPARRAVGVPWDGSGGQGERRQGVGANAICQSWVRAYPCQPSGQLSAQLYPLPGDGARFSLPDRRRPAGVKPP